MLKGHIETHHAVETLFFRIHDPEIGHGSLNPSFDWGSYSNLIRSKACPTQMVTIPFKVFAAAKIVPAESATDSRPWSYA